MALDAKKMLYNRSSVADSSRLSGESPKLPPENTEKSTVQHPQKNVITSWALKPFVLDVRSLAVSRILMSMVVVVSLFIRLQGQQFEFFYTEIGMAPRKVVIEHALRDNHVSIWMASGSQLWSALCFFVYGCAGVAYLVGYHTFQANVLLWFMEISVQNRVPFILNGGDTVLRCFLFWMIFLPSGRVLSVDRFLETRQKYVAKMEIQSTEITHVSGGSFAFLVQLFSVYWFSAMLKTGRAWHDGTAVYYAMQLDHFVKEPFASFLRSREYLWRNMCPLTLYWEYIGALMLLIPSDGIRKLIVAKFILMHIGFHLGMEIGMFPAICSVYWIAFLPGTVWDDCGWVVNDDILEEGLSRTKTLSHKPPEIRLEDRVKYWRYLAFQCVAFCLAVVIVIPLNLSHLKTPLARFSNYQRTISNTLKLDQKHDMFAPQPMTRDGWFLLPAVLKNGTEVDLWKGGFLKPTSIHWATDEETSLWNVSLSHHDPIQQRIYQLSRAKPRHISSVPENNRWRKLIWQISNVDKYKVLRIHFGKGLCRVWNKYNKGDERLDTWQLVFMRQDNLGPQNPPEKEVKPILVWNHYCFGNPKEGAPAPVDQNISIDKVLPKIEEFSSASPVPETKESAKNEL